MVARLISGEAPGVHLGYQLDAVDEAWVSVPDGRCGITYARGQLWWFGPSSRPWSAHGDPGVVIGVRLTFSAGRAVAGEPLRRWRDRRAPLTAIWEKAVVTDLEERIALAADAAQTVASLSAAVSHCLQSADHDPGLAERLANQVAAGASVADLACGLRLTPRQVCRRFDDVFGMPPTTLRRILRLHRAARHRMESRQLTLADVAAAAGYADQAHLSRDSRALTLSSAGVALSFS